MGDLTVFVWDLVNQGPRENQTLISKASNSHHLPGAAQDRRPGRVLHVGVARHHDPSDGPR